MLCLLFFGGLLLFIALHCNVFMLSVLVPVRVMEVVSVPATYVMFVDPRYQVMVGAGTALLFTTHRTSLWVPSLIASGLSLGIKETLWTLTVNQFILRINEYYVSFTKIKMIPVKQNIRFFNCL